MLEDSRLEKLVKLLDSKNPVIRGQVAGNFGDIARNHPDESPHLLRRIYDSLGKNSWDTRVAAADALAEVLRFYLTNDNERLEICSNKAQLWFNLSETLAEGQLLFGAAEKEYSAVEVTSDGVVQRQQLERHLKVDRRIGLDTREWVSDEDIRATKTEQLSQLPPKLGKRDSAKAQEALTQLLECQEPTMVFRHLLDALSAQLFSSRWENRHGAALALKQLCARFSERLSQSDFAGVIEQLLDVLCLDRFNDFVAGCSVAPVRETCAQVVAVLSPKLEKSVCEQLFSAVESLLKCQPIWECRQSGLLILKYMLPVLNETLSLFIPSILLALEDQNEEICSLAALTLVASCESLAQEQQQWSEVLIGSIWKLLHKTQTTDSESSAGLLRLVKAWLSSHADVTFGSDEIFVILSYLDNASLATRMAAFECLRRFCALKNDCWSNPILVQELIRTLYRHLVTEPSASALVRSILDNCSNIVAALDGQVLVDSCCIHLGAWLACLMVPDDSPLIDTAALQLDKSPPVSQNGVGSQADHTTYICGQEICSLNQSERGLIVAERKLQLARFVCLLFERVSKSHAPRIEEESAAQSLKLLVLLHLESSSAYQQTAVLSVLSAWSQIENHSDLPEEITNALLQKLSAPSPVFEETALKIAELNAACGEFLKESLPNGALQSAPISSADAALSLCRNSYETALESGMSAPKLEHLKSAWQRLSANLELVGPELEMLQRRVACFQACVLVNWGIVPDKLNPLIKPLMDTVKAEPCLAVATEAARALAKLLQLVQSRTPCPNAKLVKNLATFYCSAMPKMQDFETEEEVRILPSKLEPNVCSMNSGVVLRHITEQYGQELESRLPSLHALLNLEGCAPEDLQTKLRVCELVYGQLPTPQRKILLENSPNQLQYLASPNAVFRQSTGRFLAKVTEFDVIDAVNKLLPWCIEAISSLERPMARAGIIEYLNLLVQQLDTKLVGLLTLVAPSVLGRMSDPELCIRETASATFSQLVKLLPLEKNEMEQKLTDSLEKKRIQNRSFLLLLSNPAALPTIDLSKIGLNEVQLRHYQKEGITWMWFLCMYELHGILCDDMGLGKTLQTLCVMASSYQQHSSKHRSLIVCPRTLVNHWDGEIKQYFGPDSALQSLICADKFLPATLSPSVRVIITSYDNLRRNSQWFSAKLWHYCILDEGHVMRNPKTQLFKAICSLRAEHRLLLSGTPIQNSVAELWSFFEFLMPGYLGTQSAFTARYAKPILQSRDAKTSSSEADAGQKALELLHKQVLPFTLRRLKTEVLKELPPKIIQDYYCQLTPVQVQLYEHVASNSLDREIGEKRAKGTAFKLLMYLRKLCDHPSLVLSADHPLKPNIISKLKSDNLSLGDLNNSGKMLALKQLLEECGIARTDNEDAIENDAVSRHRALIFCQFKDCIDLICDYLQSRALGAVTWLRLDGSTPVGQRQNVVDRFNQDPSIDLLLLTTQVGGLGLNLVGADVVIFMDHDWNPARDRQAVDRAHRLGQKRTVNVYRLITKGTLEEKIMKMQKFKTDTAQALIGEDNRSLLSMATENLLDLLTLETDSSVSISKPVGLEPKRRRVEVKKKQDEEQQWNLEELWDQSQYDDAFDVNGFLAQIGLSK